MHARRHGVFSYITNKTKRLMTTVSLKNRFWSDYDLYFYRSSGENSTQRNTWFPFKGIAKGYPFYGWIIKPQGFDDTIDVDSTYPQAFLEFVETSFANGTLKFSVNSREGIKESALDAFLSRFGNIDCLLYSYVVGGGFWNGGDPFNFSDNDSRALRKYLEENYAKEITQIKKNCPEIATLQHPTHIQETECIDGCTDICALENSLYAERRQINNRLCLDIPIPKLSENERKEKAYERKRRESEAKATKQYFTDEDTVPDLVFTIASLGMYAYLTNCIDRREESLTTPTAIAKIALAVLLPPVAMIIGAFSFFCLSKKQDTTEKNPTRQVSLSR